VNGLVLFGGEITADTILARASATAAVASTDGSFDGTTAQNLQALGAPVPIPAVPNATFPLAHWGPLSFNRESVPRGTTPCAGACRGPVTAADTHLTADHGGLPAGSEIQIGYAEVGASPLPPLAPKPATKPATTTAATPTTTEAATTPTATTTTAPTTTTT